MNKTKFVLLMAIVGIIAAFFAFDAQQFLTLEFFKAQRADITQLYLVYPIIFIGGFMAVYVLSTALSLPGASLLTIFAGALFDLTTGVIIVSFASTVGATCAFLITRYFLRDTVQRKFGDKLKTFNDGIKKEGAFYLFTLRIVPVVPFFVINILMALTPIKTWTFFWVSQLGMLAGTIVYVNAGTQIAKLDSLSGIISLPLLGSFVLLGVFPLVAKKILESIKRRAGMKKFSKPKSYDANLVVIGAGAAGLVSSYIASAVKAKVVLIEKHKMGGDCLNTGCVPSKALIRSAKIASYMSRAEEFGLEKVTPKIAFPQVMQRVQRIIKRIEPHDSVHRYTNLGVDCIQGEAEIISPYCVRVNGREITTRNIIVATGARPVIPEIEGLENANYYTSDTIWGITEFPKRLIVLGGGPIGCELTQCFSRLGSHVVQVERSPRLMIREDEDVSTIIHQKFIDGGIDVKVSSEAIRIEGREDEQYLVCRDKEGVESFIPFDALLIAVGRQANTTGFGLENIGVEITERGTIAVNEHLQTNIPTIYACGDVSGPFQFTHTAAHQAWYASVNSLFGGVKKFRVDYSVIPWATFTDPEAARVGINVQEAIEQGIDYEVTQYEIDDLDRAIADEEAHGFVRVLTKRGTDKILGVTIVGHHAGEIIAEYVLAMKHGLGLNKILGTIHIYPTLNESNKYVAGLWKKAHAPEAALRWLKRYHKWLRKSRSETPGIPETETVIK
ncbi:MAG: FAD-dependent oxidoreductase [Ectothiorhodospiraceae bacterium]|nr:FAD-dependent oxidoreductase [Ectothiorhodospiraceae bacterium]